MSTCNGCDPAIVGSGSAAFSVAIRATELGARVATVDRGDVVLAPVHAVQVGLTVDQVVDTWAPYQTKGEGFKLAAQTFDREVAYLSRCA